MVSHNSNPSKNVKVDGITIVVALRCCIRPAELLCDAEHDLLVIAELLVIIDAAIHRCLINVCVCE